MSVIARDGRFSNDDIDTYGCFVIVISNSALHQNGQTIFFMTYWIHLIESFY